MWEVLAKGEEEGDEEHEFSLSPYEMLPASRAYSHYMGSLTTPPCTEVRGYFIFLVCFYLLNCLNGERTNESRPQLTIGWYRFEVLTFPCVVCVFFWERLI